MAEKAYIPVSVAAKKLEKDARTVRRMCEDATLVARKVHPPRGHWQISRADLMNHLMKSHSNPKTYA